MKKSVYFIIFLFVFLFSLWPISAAATLNVATQWAPIICQVVDHSDGLTAPQNIFTLVNYDRDWRLNNNWYNMRFYSLDQAMYYSVVESETHYFISYYQYYPRYIGGGDHEHDMTGVLVAVSKTPDQSGRLDMLVTYSNNKWQKWDGSRVQLEGSHPALSIHLTTHEITANGKNNRVLGRDGIHMISSSNNLMQRGDNNALPGGTHIGYHLVSLTQLWDHCQDIGQGRVFARWGYFDSYNSVKATAPWVWEYHQINWLTKPGELIQYFKRIAVKPCNYLVNPYQSNMK